MQSGTSQKSRARNPSQPRSASSPQASAAKARRAPAAAKSRSDDDLTPWADHVRQTFTPAEFAEMKAWVKKTSEQIVRRDSRRFLRRFEKLAAKGGIPTVGNDPQKATLENLRHYVTACGGSVFFTVQLGDKWWNL